MTGNSGVVESRTARFAGRRLDAHYLCFCDSLKGRCRYEAHDALENLWLVDCNGPDGAFFKGRIRLAPPLASCRRGGCGRRPGC